MYETLIGTDVGHAADLLRKGELVAVPTETVYGLAGCALNVHAIAKIFEVKKRPYFDPLIVHIGRPVMLEQLVKTPDPVAQLLIDTFWPGPLTILFEKTDAIHPVITAGSERVAIRMPAHDLTLQLLNELGQPMAAPSANPFGYISPTLPAHVFKHLAGLIPYILDGGPCQVGIESTIVGKEGDSWYVYRPGIVDIEKLEACSGVRFQSKTNPIHVAAPGQLLSHYAPKKPLFIGSENVLSSYRTANKALLTFTGTPYTDEYGSVVILSEKGVLEEAAAKFYAALHMLDAGSADIIVAMPFPDTGLGRVLNERLLKAAFKSSSYFK